MGRDDEPEGATDVVLISIHSPRMGRDEQCHRQTDDHEISIHSPRMGRDDRRGFHIFRQT